MSNYFKIFFSARTLFISLSRRSSLDVVFHYSNAGLAMLSVGFRDLNAFSIVVRPVDGLRELIDASKMMR